MEIFNYKFANKPIEIVPFGDLHLGSPECDMKFAKKIVNKIKERNAKCILLGDLCDVGLRESPGASVYENIFNPRKQLEELHKLFLPIRKNILGSIVGNHEYRLEKSTSLCLTNILCDSLDIPYGHYQMMNVINIGKEKYKIFSIHGSSNAMTTEGRINAFKKQLTIIDSDIYTFGHTHDTAHKIFYNRAVENNKVFEQEKHMLLCGNFMDYGGYAEFKGLPILHKGCPLIKLYPNKHKIEVDLNWWK